MTDRDDQHRSQAPPVEGVRILGAEEAQAALDQTAQQRAVTDDSTSNGRDTEDDERATDPSPDELDLRSPAIDDAPTWSASTDAPAETPSGEIPELPHWTEPPTGAVPAIFADDDDNGDELDVWATITGSQPRFRAEGSDWADPDFVEDLSGEHSERLGALSEAGPVDEEAEFAEALAARRRRTPRGRPARHVTTPAPRTRTAEEPRPEPAGRDLPTALVTAAFIVVAALICFRLGPVWTTVLASVIIGLATLEFANTLRQRGFKPATALALMAAVTLPLSAEHYGVAAYPVFVGLIVLFAMLWFLWEVTPGRPLLGIATTVLTFAYVGGLGGFAGLLLGAPDGVGLIIGVAACVVAYDVIGYFVGSQFGHSPIAPNISPHKTLEGTIAGMLGSVLVGVFIISHIHPWDLKRGLALGILVAIGAFLGDLCESMIKRDLDLKDFSGLLPGHGGVLDRFDGLLFCLPIVYYLAVQLKIA